MNKREMGGRYETAAASYLEARGYRIVERNYRCRQGEIDLIASQGGYTVFIEVKYRRNGELGEPAEAVGVYKQRTIRQTAGYYLYSRGLPPDTPCRFDVVGIMGEKGAEQIRLYKNAF